jgi:hemerythrin-like domain-containing protein
MKATEELRNEHQGIELMLRVLEAVSDEMDRGAQVSSDHLDGIMEFLSVFVDKCHHGKEEEFLFPSLEAAGVPREEGPIEVLLLEHMQGRSLYADLKKAADRIKSGAAPESFQITALDYVALLTQHIDKENNVLFPLADAKLNAAKDAELVEAFEQLEKDRIGPGKHEEFHRLLGRLEQEYLE